MLSSLLPVGNFGSFEAIVAIRYVLPYNYFVFEIRENKRRRANKKNLKKILIDIDYRISLY